MLKLLVVDCNRVYAKRVKNTLERLAPSVSVDIAANAAEARSRIANKGPYVLILADLYLAVNPSEIQTVLDEVETPKLIWSVLGGSGKQQLKNMVGRLSAKPTRPEDLTALLTDEVLTVVSGE